MDNDGTYTGNLTVGGQIVAGTSEQAITLSDGHLDGSTLEPGSITSTQLGSGAIESSNVADGAVSNVDLHADAVTTDKIADGTIITVDLADNAVTTDKIADGTIITVDLADNAVTTGKIADGAIGAADLASNSVTTGKIADGTVATADLANNSVTTGKIADGTVATADLANDSVTADKIADGAVAAANLQDGAVTNTKIGVQQILGSHLQVSTVTGDKIAANAIVSTNIVNSSILAEDLFDGIITSVKIADGAVNSAKILDNAVSSADILDATITGTDIQDASIAAADLAASAVSNAKIATSAVSTAKIADDAVTPAKLDDTLTYSVGKLGVNTSAVPVGDLGYAKMALHGTQNDMGSPSVQFTTAEGAHPVMCLTAMQHNSAQIRFDCYSEAPEGGCESNWQRSSCASSCAEILKYADSLSLLYPNVEAAPLTPGCSFVWKTGFRMSCTTGAITMPAVYDQDISSTRQLFIDETGKIGFVPSSIRMKKNVRDAADADTGFIYALRPVMFDYKDPAMGTNQCGLIAEEVETVCPRIVSYKREVSYVPSTDPNDHSDVPTPVYTTTNIPETVSYDKLVVPMLAEMQRLKKRVDELETANKRMEALEARLAALEPKN